MRKLIGNCGVDEEGEKVAEDERKRKRTIRRRKEKV